jgi:hypothetical protein
MKYLVNDLDQKRVHTIETLGVNGAQEQKWTSRDWFLQSREISETKCNGEGLSNTTKT